MLNDAQIRVLISEARATHSQPGGNPDAYQLALIAEEMMQQRNRRSEDWYAANRRVAALEAEVEGLRDALTHVAEMCDAAARIARGHDSRP